MASTSSDPDAAILVDTISRHDPLSIYDLARNFLKWSYGKTERKVADLIKSGKLYSRSKVENGRNIKFLSLKPTVERFDSPGSVPDIVKEAFLHLYGVFKVLGKDVSDNGLVKYCETASLKPNELSKMFNEVRQMCSQPKTKEL